MQQHHNLMYVIMVFLKMKDMNLPDGVVKKIVRKLW